VPTVGRFRFLEAAPRAGARPRGALVVIHAFPLGARMFEAQLALADRGWRVIAPELRGFDGATGEPSASSIDDYAADVIDLLDALHVDEAVIGGVSMGGYIAFAMFRHAPRYFQGLILADTKSQADTPEALDGRRKMLQLVQEKGPPAVADEMIPKLLGETTRRTRPQIVELVRSLVLANSTDAIAGAIRALMTRPDSTPLLSTIHRPALILVGDEDVVTPKAVAEEMHRGIAGSQLAIVPGAGHLSNLEQPEAFNAALADFLDHRL
jgi:pimeloyl-ACP methyl ester carboxylesterase